MSNPVVSSHVWGSFLLDASCRILHVNTCGVEGRTACRASILLILEIPLNGLQDWLHHVYGYQVLLMAPMHKEERRNH